MTPAPERRLVSASSGGAASSHALLQSLNFTFLPSTVRRALNGGGKYKYKKKFMLFSWQRCIRTGFYGHANTKHGALQKGKKSFLLTKKVQTRRARRLTILPARLMLRGKTVFNQKKLWEMKHDLEWQFSIWKDKVSHFERLSGLY